MDDDVRLSAARWHVDRYDRLRTMTANRAAVVLSADALILAAIALFIPVYLQAPITVERTAVVILSFIALVEIGLVITSVSFALAAMINVRPSRELFAISTPRSIIYHHSDTVSEIRTFDAFQKYFMEEFSENELAHAVSALWLGLTSHSYRFHRLRRATTLLHLAIVGLYVFSASVILLRASS